MRKPTPSHAVFVAAIIAIGIMGLLGGTFGPIWEPIAKDFPHRILLAYACGAISIGASVAIFWRRSAALGAAILATLILAWIIAFRAPPIVKSPAMAAAWEGCGETVVLFVAAWIIYLRAANERRLRWLSGNASLRVARSLFGLALIAFGIAHFAYLSDTSALVPAWLPLHSFFTMLTGISYIAAGVAILINVYARWAAIAATIQMGVFTVLVWMPPVFAGPSAEQWSECVISWVLTIGGWVIADSYANRDKSIFADHR